MKLVTEGVEKGIVLGVFISIGAFAVYKFVEVQRYKQWKAEYEASGKIPNFTPY